MRIGLAIRTGAGISFAESMSMEEHVVLAALIVANEMQAL